jgi:hypothetical protein
MTTESPLPASVRLLKQSQIWEKSMWWHLTARNLAWDTLLQLVKF